MKIAIMQPYLFPYIGYFQLINAVDKFIIFDDVNFIKKGWINRNRILLNGTDYLFTIPCSQVSQNKLIYEIEVVDQKKTIQKLLRTFESAYSTAPLFERVMKLLKEILDFEKIKINELIFRSITIILDYLEIKKEIVFSSRSYTNQYLKKAERIVDICKIEKATNYINPINGKCLYDKKYFNDNGVNISFLQSQNIEYKQFGYVYVPNLSIIDVMMFNEKKKIHEFLNQYSLV